MRGRLNLFQRTMLRWREQYPYTAVHVVRVDVALDADALAASIGTQLAAWGLTGLTLDAHQRHYDYQGGPAAPKLAVLANHGDAEAALDAEIERQLNMPFPEVPGRDPFRFFAIPVSGGFQLGMAYDHFIAGGDAIAGLLGAIVARHCGQPGTGAPPPLYPSTYRNFCAQRPWLMLRALAQLPRVFKEAKRAMRPRYANPDDEYNLYTHFRLSPMESAALRAKVNALSVSLNDLLIAVLLRALSQAATERREARRRHEIAISSIVNLRRDFGTPMRLAFGQFLAFMRVTHPVPEGIALDVLAREVHDITEGIKRDRRDLATVQALAVAALYWPFLRAHHRKRFFGKHVPATGGTTTLHVDPLWSAAGVGTAHDYLRAVSTGPVTAIVLAVSTAGGALSVGISCRRAAFDPSVLARVETQLRECAASAPP